MKRFLSLIFLSVLFSSSLSAEIFWASRILSYSSQLDVNAYSAKQVLGPPSKLPSFGDCGCAWTPSMPNNNLEEFIRVGFEKKIRVREIIISENFNAGSIKAIYLFDQYNIPHLVYERTRLNAEYGRVFTITIPATEFETNDLKLVLDTESVPGYNQIDAIGIADEEDKLETKEIMFTDRINFKGDAQKMGYGINSFGTEITPLTTPDGNTLYFTRKDHPGNTGTVMNDDIWVTHRLGNKWTEPVNAGAPLNNENNNYVIGISNNGNMLSLANTYNFSGESKAGIAQSWRKDSTWKYPVNLITQGIITYNFFAEYYMNEDRSVLLISLEKSDSHGLKDIYVSFSSNQLMWTVPVNLGNTINTVSNEMAPFLSPDGNLLFFSSDGMPGFGEQDIYVSERLDESWTKWSAPENLGPKVNSDGFDAYFTYGDSSSYAYFTSTRDEYLNPDIYQIAIKDVPKIKEDTIIKNDTAYAGQTITDTEGEEVSKEVDVELTNDYLLFGTVFDAETALPVEAELIFKLNEYDTEPESVSTLNKNYRKKITGNISYKVIILKPGYLYKEEVVSITDFNTQKVKRIDFKLEPVKKGETFILNDLNFDANSSIIKSSSYPQMNALYNFLTTNPNLHIEIGGHTNGLCDDAFCTKLSGQRADAVMKYLVAKGIDPARLSSAGYGKSKPVTSDDTPEGRKKNQRVEVKIL